MTHKHTWSIASNSISIDCSNTDLHQLKVKPQAFSRKGLFYEYPEISVEGK